MAKAPVAKKKEHLLTLHGHQRIDNYFWLRDRENKDVIKYIEAENKYTKDILAPTDELQKTLYQEMRLRIKEDDSSVPYLKNGYWYYTRFEEGLELPINCRKKGELTAQEEILIDENQEEKDHAYYEVVAFSVSRDNKILAFTEDITGRRLYQIRFKNLETGEILDHCIENSGSDLAWHNNNTTLYYSVKDPETLRPHLIKKFDILTAEHADVYEETDETYVVNVNKSGDYKYIFIGSHSTLTTEFRFMLADHVADFELFLPRQNGHEYYPETSVDGGFYVKSNLKAPNYQLVYCDENKRSPENWEIIQAHNKDILIQDFEIFDTHLVVEEKENGLTRLRVYDKKDLSTRLIPMDEETFTLDFGYNVETSSDAVRVTYSSLTQPATVLSYDLKSLESTILKQQEVIGDFNPDNYKSKRVWAKGADGVAIPVSLVYRKDKFNQDAKNPLLLYAYGSYGVTVDPYFSSNRLSLLDRGFVFAIAHIRGGEYLGTAWYEDGKLLHKKNTFIDFVTTADFLIQEKFTDPENVFAMGGSAGGLLMGAIANLRPNLWKGVVAQVPFVDVVSTMIDDTIPLTTGEYDEWGNPNEKVFYDYMLSYSPYDQIEKKAYPAMLITSGLYDSQVQYWEPTKYVAKLRELKTNDEPTLLFTNMDAGHGGSAGRYESLKETALEYAFILWRTGL
ncbi:S9 family peptidase [Crocinitomix catalasitica]|uniref:S9 family peptidase n=1 Tax=Crocinitomix catalasitica TaxID=184607 RepID=UPI000568DCF2|nr:oligopeptidase B [Crocinitomix catalasitica]